MKKIIIIAAILMSVCSCGDWLEANSSTQFKAEQIFESGEGFQDALSGVYINMGDANSYGAALTWKYNDLVVYPYADLTTLTMVSFQKHQYGVSSVKKRLDAIWLHQYNCIANVNMILENIDSRKNVFSSESEFNWVKGECLALRAYLHFDLLRLYGLPGWTGENATKLTVPYVTSYSSEVTPQRTYEETAKLLLDDLKTAIDLLQDDPVRGTLPENFEDVINSDEYWNNRTRHLNYYAAQALLARVYQWNGQYTEAETLARSVREEALEKGAVSWVNCDAQLAVTSDDSKDYTFSTEQLFSLEVTGLYDIVAGILIPSGGGDSGDSYRLDIGFCDNTLFPSSGDKLSGLEDLRGTAFQLKYYSGQYVSYKFYSTNASNYRNNMPMVRLSELYYIEAESLVRRGESAEALRLLDEVRTHRGVTGNLDAGTDAFEELSLEYIREFIGEGQLLYWCKHDGLEHMSDALSAGLTASNLIYPYPDKEINYGRKQEL